MAEGNGRWYSVAMVAIGLIVGGAGAGGVAKYEISGVEQKMEILEDELADVKEEQAGTNGRLEQKVDDLKEDTEWIKGQVQKMLVRMLESNS